MQVPPPSTTPEAFDIPNPFGRYKLVKKLGQGGMGTVFLAEDTKLHRPVALKVPRDLAGESAEVVARFEREAQVLAGFSHPNICKIFDVGQIDGHHFLTMEYHDGRSLDRVLVPGKPLKPEQAAKIVRKLALALQQAHDRGIVHRDLKPSNVLLTTQKDLVILDFGLARPVDLTENRLTMTGVPLGTPSYMAPEQVKADPALIGPACDIYSLGVMLYEMLCGRRPFNGPITHLFAMIVHERPEPPSQFRPGLDPGLERICLKALEKEPTARPESMAAFATALGEWQAGRSAPEGPTGESLVDATIGGRRPSPKWQAARPHPEPEPGRRWPFSRWLATAFGALFVVILGVVIWVTTDKGTIKITSDDPKLSVKVDKGAVVVENLDQPLTLRAGEHTLEVTYGDLSFETRTLRVKRGVFEVVDLPKKAVVPPDPKQGTIKIMSDDPKLTIKVDGTAAKLDEPLTLSAGDHALEVTYGTLEVEPRTLTVKPGMIDVVFLRKKAVAPPIEKDEAKAPPVPVVVPKVEVAKAAVPVPAVLIEGTRAGEEREDNALKLKLCWCPSGTFRMGSPANEPGHGKDEDQVDVTLTRGFWLGKYEVTQEQWRKVMGTTLTEQNSKSSHPGISGEGPIHPMYHVNHTEAEEFCRKLTDSERAAGRLPAGWEYRLPTEAEWEYACRAGSTTAFSFGDDPAKLGEYAWFGEKSGNQTHPAGTKRPNAFGLHDMHGNVWEWCQDGYDAKLTGGVDPVGSLKAPDRVERGGGWEGTPAGVRSAYRVRDSPEFRDRLLGFRLARVQSVR